MWPLPLVFVLPRDWETLDFLSVPFIFLSGSTKVVFPAGPGQSRPPALLEGPPRPPMLLTRPAAPATPSRARPAARLGGPRFFSS